MVFQSLGAEDFGGFARRRGYMDLKTGVTGSQGELYPIGVKASLRRYRRRGYGAWRSTARRAVGALAGAGSAAVVPELAEQLGTRDAAISV